MSCWHGHFHAKQHQEISFVNDVFFLQEHRGIENIGKFLKYLQGGPLLVVSRVISYNSICIGVLAPVTHLYGCFFVAQYMSEDKKCLQNPTVGMRV